MTDSCRRGYRPKVLLPVIVRERVVFETSRKRHDLMTHYPEYGLAKCCSINPLYALNCLLTLFLR